METARGWVGIFWAIGFELLTPGVTFAEISPEWFVLAGKGPVRSIVSSPAEAAMKKLGRPACAAVLADFRDGAGRLLSENLGALDLRAPEYFARLRFVDGRTVAFCERSEVAAAVSPGNRVVVICTATFARLRRDDPSLATSGLIHEMLHTLGLEENPPTSEEITRQVVKRCGP